MRKNLVLLWISTFLLCSTSFAKTGNTISLNNFIKAYLEHTYDVREKYESVRKAKGAKLSAEASDDLTLSAEAGYTGAYGINDTSGVNGNLVTGQVGLSESFSATGTTLSVKDAFGGGKIAGINGGSNQITLSVLQPVLKNFFGYISRIGIAQAALSLKAAELAYQESVESAMSDAITLYLQWISYYKESQMLKEIISNNQVVFRQTRAQLRAGIAEVSDLEISRASVLQYQIQLSSNNSSYQSLVLELNDYLPITMDDKPDLNIINDTTLDIPDIDINPNYIRSIRELNYMMDSAQLGLDSVRNSFLPELDIVASYINSHGNQTYLGSYASATGKNNFYLGAQLSLPLFFLSVRGSELQAIASYQELLLERDDAIRTLIRNVKEIQAQLTYLNEELQQQRTLIGSLQRRVASQTRQFRRGTVDLDTLVTGRNALSNALLTENDLQVQNAKLYHSYLASVDKLEEKYQNAIPSIFHLV